MDLQLIDSFWAEVRRVRCSYTLRVILMYGSLFTVAPVSPYIYVRSRSELTDLTYATVCSLLFEPEPKTISRVIDSGEHLLGPSPRSTWERGILNTPPLVSLVSGINQSGDVLKRRTCGGCRAAPRGSTP